MIGELGPAEPDLWAEAAGLPPAPRVERLDNGLTLCLLPDARAPLVVTALWYRAGSRDEPPGLEGVAHFLEHMMFKGSPGYAEGDVDRLTQAAGGVNNAFTTHDATCYQFAFAGQRWDEALSIEADRMRALDLEPAAVERERRVILEELATIHDQAWEALELEVSARLFGSHPYGRPIVGTRSALAAISAEDLATFHRRCYGPSRAVLVLAGDLPPAVVEMAAERFAALPPRGPARPPLPRPEPPERVVRLERRRGGVDRLLLALPAPAADHPDHAPLRLLAMALGGGRSSRLHVSLVEEGRLCVWLGVELSESVEDGVLTFALEAAPGVEPERLEEALLAELDRWLRDPPTDRELGRARRSLVADHLFACERLETRAMIVGQAVALYDADFSARQLRRLAATDRDQLSSVAERYLRPAAGAVVGWSLAEERIG